MTVNRKTVACVALASFFCCAGCSSSYVVSSLPNAGKSFPAFNHDAYDRSGTIRFHDGSEMDARNIVASPDSLRFLSEETAATTVVSTRSVASVEFTNHLTGLLEGAGWGALGGGVTMLAIRAAAGPNGGEMSGWSYDLFFTFLGAAGGAVIGGIPGAIIGHSHSYRFMAVETSLTK
jgi:hypothetical protein